MDKGFFSKELKKQIFNFFKMIYYKYYCCFGFHKPIIWFYISHFIHKNIRIHLYWQFRYFIVLFICKDIKFLEFFWYSPYSIKMKIFFIRCKLMKLDNTIRKMIILYHFIKYILREEKYWLLFYMTYNISFFK